MGTIYRRRIEDYHIGDIAIFTKTITETDVALFGAISGDFYPIHFNEELAKKNTFWGTYRARRHSSGLNFHGAWRTVTRAGNLCRGRKRIEFSLLAAGTYGRYDYGKSNCNRSNYRASYCKFRFELYKSAR